MKKEHEAPQVSSARRLRASKLADAFLKWRSLAAQNNYPRSLVDICEQSLVREYALGRKAVKP